MRSKHRFTFSSNLTIYGDNMNKISDVKKVILSKPWVVYYTKMETSIPNEMWLKSKHMPNWSIFSVGFYGPFKNVSLILSQSFIKVGENWRTRGKNTWPSVSRAFPHVTQARKLIKFHQFVHKILSWNKILTITKGHSSVVNLQKLMQNNPFLDVVKVNAYAKFDLTQWIHSQDIQLKWNPYDNQGPCVVALRNNPNLDPVNVMEYAKLVDFY